MVAGEFIGWDADEQEPEDQAEDGMFEAGSFFETDGGDGCAGDGAEGIFAIENADDVIIEDEGADEFVAGFGVNPGREFHGEVVGLGGESWVL